MTNDLPPRPTPAQLDKQRRDRNLGTERWKRLRRQILERDAWVCHYCGQPIDPQVKWPDPMSAAVDHIIPRSKGGDTFDPGNCRASHFRCNSQRNVLGDDRNPYRSPPSRDW